MPYHLDLYHVSVIHRCQRLAKSRTPASRSRLGVKSQRLGRSSRCWWLGSRSRTGGSWEHPCYTIFLLYINDPTNILSNINSGSTCSVKLYADDVKLYSSFKITDFSVDLVTVLDRVIEWASVGYGNLI